MCALILLIIGFTEKRRDIPPQHSFAQLKINQLNIVDKYK